jgi:hypothetical protein
MDLRLQHVQCVVAETRATQRPHDLLRLRAHHAATGDCAEHPEAAGDSHQVASVHLIPVRRQEIGQGVRLITHVIGDSLLCRTPISTPVIDARILRTAGRHATVRLVEQFIELRNCDAQQFREARSQHQEGFELPALPAGNALLCDAQPFRKRFLRQTSQTA